MSAIRRCYTRRQRDLVDWIIAGLIAVASVLGLFFVAIVFMAVRNG